MTFTLPAAQDVGDPRGRGYGCILNNTPFRLAPSSQQPVRIQSARAQAPQVTTAENAEEFVSDVGRAFSLGDTSGGAGLLLRHRRTRSDSDAIRYWDSRGVRVGRLEFGSTPAISLLEATIRTALPSRTRLRAATLSGSAYVGSATAAAIYKVTPNGAGAAPTITSEPTPVSPGGAVASLGGKIYFAAGSTVYAGPGTYTSVNTSVVGAVDAWAAAGRLIITGNGKLYEIADPAVNAATLLHTLPAGETWESVVDGGSAILAGASDGRIFAWAPDDTGALALIGQTTIPGERVWAIHELQGVVLVATAAAGTTRLWSMALQDGQLSGRVVREWDSAGGVDRAAQIASDRESAYVMVNDAGEMGVWRYDVVAGAIHRWWLLDVTGLAHPADPRFIVMVGDQPVIGGGQAGQTECNVWTVDSKLEPEGWIMSPMADFFSPEPKTWAGVNLVLDAIPDGAQVELLVATEMSAMSDPSVGWRSVATRLTAGGAESVPLSGITARSLAGQIRLTAAEDRTEGPSVLSVAFRALLASTDVLVTLPVAVSDIIEQPYKRPVRIPGMGQALFAALREMERTSVSLEVYDPPLRIRGQVESVDTPAPVRTRRGTQILVSEVVVRGREASTAADTLLTGPLGTFTLGSQPMGGAT